MQKEREASAPKPLPRKRPRALTCPLPAKPASSRSRLSNPFKIFSRQQRTFDQSQSPLVARLPLEIRQLIWTEVLGGRFLHIVYAHKTLMAIECVEDFGPELETVQHGCWGKSVVGIGGFSSGVYHWPLRDHPAKPTNLLPLIQTCRIIYTEAMPVLYESNVFDFKHLDTLLYLNRTVLSQRLRQIRVLNLSWHLRHGVTEYDPPNDFTSWRETCLVLATFTGLQDLSVHVVSRHFIRGSLYEEDCRPLLEALTLIKPAKRFDVYLPWTEDQCGEVANDGGYPFRLTPIARESYSGTPFRLIFRDIMA
jgi:hypothetical protein